MSDFFSPRNIAGASLFLWLGLFSGTVLGLQVIMETEIIPVSASSHNIILFNEADYPIAAEVSVRYREYTLDGFENYEKPFKGVVPVPAQIIIPARQEQVVTLRRIESFDFKNQLPLRLVVENVPIALDKDGNPVEQAAGGLQLIYRIVRGLYITPPKAKHDVVIEKVEDKGDVLELTMRNQGTGHKIYWELDLLLADNSKAFIDNATMKGGINIMAGTVRRISIPKPKVWSKSAWQKVKIVEED